jgi:ribosomal protein L15E
MGRRSDFDVALANQSIFNRAKQLGYKAKDGTKIGPLNNDQLTRLGLLNYAKKARETSGRTTEFMLFDTSKSARTRPSIEVLLEEEGL